MGLAATALPSEGSGSVRSPKSLEMPVRSAKLSSGAPCALSAPDRCLQSHHWRARTLSANLLAERRPAQETCP
eukprot:336503-Rhodomonas_salina.1